MGWYNLSEWLDLVLRWFHVMAAITWIGSTFYFMWLGRIFASSERQLVGESGEPWMIHSTGFALTSKFKPGPGEALKMLHWFKRESALTWLSGIVLLFLVYFLSGGAYLAVKVVSTAELIGYAAFSAALIMITWVVYDRLWESALARRPVWAVGASFAFLMLVAWGLSQIFTGRAVYVYVGSILGTVMVGNVWLRVLPAVRDMTNASESGSAHNPATWASGQVRSLHNSYLAFPVVALMLSIHRPAIHASPLNVIVLAVLLIAFVAARHIVVGGRRSKWALGVVALALTGMIMMTGGTPLQDVQRSEAPIEFAVVRALITERCLGCHSTTPADRTFGVTPGGVSFDTPEDIRRFAPRIRQRIVAAEAMPFRNHPRPTAEERDLLGRWVDQGAVLQ
jgi:uncharacterized membrane protein